MIICICGGGTMGSGIAQVAALAGHSTMIYDMNREVLEKSREKILIDLDKLLTRGKISFSKKEEVISQLRFSTDLSICVADIIIEAVIENLDVKIELFNKLAIINKDSTIFATNTSSLSITEIAEKINYPERVAGLHFFNPATLMKLVEVVKGEKTAPWVIEQLVSLTKQMGKVPVVCKDSPGFIVNRVARPYYIESLRLAEMGIDFEIIDSVLEGQGFKMGPFKLMDLIGNDINYAVSCSVYEQLDKPERLKPSFIQKEKVDKGELGRKTGKGYYEYHS